MFLIAGVFAAFAASALAGSYAAKGAFQINASITNTDPVVTNPVFATQRATCNAPPSTSAVSGSFHYKVYRFRNISENILQCVDVSLAVNSGTADAAIYQDAFNPNNLDNFRNDTGGLGAGQTRGIQFLGLANSTGSSYFDVVVWETTQNGGASYNLLVEGTNIILVSGGPPTAATGLQSFRADRAPQGIVVRWRTRSEQGALGFNVYRGATKKVRLTRSIVRASGAASGHSYSYLDRSASKNKRGPYYLEVVERSGSKVMFGPALTTTR